MESEGAYSSSITTTMDRPHPHTVSSDGYSDLEHQLSALVVSYPPPFIYVHDPCTTRVATSTVLTTLSNVKNNGTNVVFAHINAIACFTPRLLYNNALNALAGWTPSWEDGCSNWTGPLEGTSQRFNESFDGFTHGLRAIDKEIASKRAGSSVNGNGKNRATAEGDGDLRLVLVIESAERLKETMPDLLAPLARLHELVSSRFILRDYSGKRAFWWCVRLHGVSGALRMCNFSCYTQASLPIF